ncbi:beta-ketoacyl-[acyl-carrier-protein] synthase family protein [Pyxidicoccus sp. MSG2]|uniref:beta-ketoacyl-[acyl-carrier-protein] synthase family protein n=1 Tax=Pyxidicoccus sp. MSG2 TaxID=2996790 RepID=UPI00226E1BEB|nr:beta-ketoacyl-[acyl-carrier-protein] synthase family protein [Pyxidicoccus sp. MSG2]MCY1014478.1 beta-ketoacyl-[acyl-carrier-protein] synthase family protein [Pyxidicoccus sp. MSG2]
MTGSTRVTDEAENMRIVITGMGAVSPYGAGVPALLGALAEGRSAIRPIEDFDTAGCACTHGARVPQGSLAALTGSNNLRRAPRGTQYTMLATEEALQMAGHGPSTWNPERVGVFLGTYRANAEVSQEIWHRIITSEPRFVQPLLFQETVTNAVASALSIRWGWRGTNYAISAGNACGFQVLALAAQALRSGRADAIIASTFDLITAATHYDMNDIGVLSDSNVSRPFDSRRDGFIMGEGAAVVVLETLASARARGATPLAEIAGLGVAHDGHGFGTHHPEGRGLASAMSQALRGAAVSPEAVDYIAAASNSTQSLDRAEVAALRTVLGAAAGTVPLSSLKALTGEAEAASDMFNLLACIGAVRGGGLPLQVGTEQPEFGLNLVRQPQAPRPVRAALAHSYSFGGSAGAALVRAL